MAYEYTIISSFGYVIPRNILTKEEEDAVFQLVEKVPGIGICSHGNFHKIKTEDSQIFIHNATLTDILVNTTTWGENDNFNCGDFACLTYVNDDIEDPEIAIAEHNDSITKYKKWCDANLKKHVPSVYQKIKDGYNDRFNDWTFGFLH